MSSEEADDGSNSIACSDSMFEETKTLSKLLVPPFHSRATSGDFGTLRFRSNSKLRKVEFFKGVFLMDPHKYKPALVSFPFPRIRPRQDGPSTARPRWHAGSYVTRRLPLVDTSGRPVHNFSPMACGELRNSPHAIGGHFRLSRIASPGSAQQDRLVNRSSPARESV